MSFIQNVNLNSQTDMQQIIIDLYYLQNLINGLTVN